HVAITNSNGAGEKPAAWIVELLAGKIVHVLHDADQAGERGAAGWDDEAGRHRPGWCEAIATVASECRDVRLPYSVSGDHEKEVRDWVNDGHGYRDLIDLAAQGEVSAAGGIPPQAEAIEAHDDP